MEGSGLWLQCGGIWGHRERQTLKSAQPGRGKEHSLRSRVVHHPSEGSSELLLVQASFFFLSGYS